MFPQQRIKQIQQNTSQTPINKQIIERKRKEGRKTSESARTYRVNGGCIPFSSIWKEFQQPDQYQTNCLYNPAELMVGITFFSQRHHLCCYRMYIRNKDSIRMLYHGFTFIGTVTEETYFSFVQIGCIRFSSDNVGLHFTNLFPSLIIDGSIHFHPTCIQHRAIQSIALRIIPDDSRSQQFQRRNTDQRNT